MRLIPTERLVLPGDTEAQARENKCDDCCPVIGCDRCGPCPRHPVTDGGIAEEP
jgi:hypothetical protein